MRSILTPPYAAFETLDEAGLRASCDAQGIDPDDNQFIDKHGKLTWGGMVHVT